MLSQHVQLFNTGTRPNPPRLKIDPAFMPQLLPHPNPEDNLRPDTMCTSTVSSPSANTSVMSPYSYSPSFTTSLPQTPDEDDDSCWNLIPYDVPWGQDYFAYKAGSLPGPEGDCLFLRSPTPVEKRRTVRACEKCRERKAKCSGDRPSCVRCAEKGRPCVYTSDSRRTRASTSSRKICGRDHVPSSYRRRQGLAEHSSPASSMSSFGDSDAQSYAVLTPKQEEDERMVPLFTNQEQTEVNDWTMGNTYNPVSFEDPTFVKLQLSPQERDNGHYDIPAPLANNQHITGHGEFISLPPNHTSSLAPPIVAPKPVRCGNTPFSPSTATREAAGSMHPTAVDYEPYPCVDPSVLVHSRAPVPPGQSVELLSGDAALHPFSSPMTAGPSASSYHPHLEYTRDMHYHDGVSVYSDTEIYENPTSQLGQPSFLSYALHYRYAADALELQAAALHSF
ncbi:hypothetical protein BDW22DRAFT_1358809 [Trametopsis cervina]|nr:hypothetical protein BDW22DRAFT_1358809 [Trametopsis cervina]